MPWPVGTLSPLPSPPEGHQPPHPRTLPLDSLEDLAGGSLVWGGRAHQSPRGPLPAGHALYLCLHHYRQGLLPTLLPRLRLWAAGGAAGAGGFPQGGWSLQKAPTGIGWALPTHLRMRAMVSFLSFPWNGRDPVSISNCRDTAQGESSDQQTQQQREPRRAACAHVPHLLGTLRRQVGRCGHTAEPR